MNERGFQKSLSGFPLSTTRLTGTIVGGRSAKQVEGIIDAAEFGLSEVEINEIETSLSEKFQQVSV